MKNNIIMILVFSIFLNGCSILKSPAPKKTEPIVANNVTLEGIDISGITKLQLKSLIDDLAQTNNESSIDAKFDDDGKIIADKAGRMVQVNDTIDQALAASPNTQVSLIYQTIAPKLTRQVLSESELIAAYKTTISNSTNARTNNIKLTAAIINNQIVEAGQEFSFNKIVGEPTVERGFENAPIYINENQEGTGIGGGMCQVSSTLYNTVLSAGLRVTERHRHSRPVSYVPPGRDATTYTDKDFRFINNTRHKLIIRAYVYHNELKIDIWKLPSFEQE